MKKREAEFNNVLNRSCGSNDCKRYDWISQTEAFQNGGGIDFKGHDWTIEQKEGHNWTGHSPNPNVPLNIQDLDYQSRRSLSSITPRDVDYA
jgi:hypothetical protein